LIDPKDVRSSQPFELVIIFQIENLLLQTAIYEACKIYFVRVLETNSMSELEVMLSHEQNARKRSLLVLDLSRSEPTIKSIVQAARTHNCNVFGFYPHVRKELLKTSFILGVDYIVPNSRIKAKLTALLNHQIRHV
jgi:hypothetical protein